MIHDFKKSYEFGSLGEKIVYDYLVTVPNIAGVANVTEIPKFQKIDVDFVALQTNGETLKIEVKTDSKKTGNFFFETKSNVEADVQGCMYKTKADYLFYYFLAYEELYIIRMKDFREWFDTYHVNSNFTLKTLLNYNRDGETTHTTEGYVFSKKYFEEHFRAFKKKNIPYEENEE